MGNIKFFEVDFENGYSLCIKSFREPSIDDANRWLASDVIQFGSVTGVYPIEETEARKFYDFENETQWPVFGKED